jgi:hypothetical protein
LAQNNVLTEGARKVYRGRHAGQGCNRLYEHINHNDILNDKQFGFQPNSSTEKACFKLTDEILKSMNKKYSTGRIFCDLQKAFDCVKITGKFGDLIKSYLTGRFQRVNLNTKDSAN